MKSETLEEKLTVICGTEKAEEIMTMLSEHFEIDKLEIKTYKKVRLTSDNTPFNTKVEFGEKGEVIPVQAIQWSIKPYEMGRLHILFI